LHIAENKKEKTMTKICTNAIILICTATLYGCSSSSDSSDSSNTPTEVSPAVGESLTFEGNTEPAEVDADNVQAIGEAAGEAVGQAASSSALPSSVVIDQGTDLGELVRNLATNAAALALLPSGVDVSAEVCPNGGSAEVSLEGPGATSGSGPAVNTTTFNACNNGTYSISGTVKMEYDDIGDITAAFAVEYNNVTVSGLGFGTQTLNFSTRCSNASDFRTCTSSSVFAGSDGGNHQISDYSFSGNASTGFNGNATFSHESYGSVSITVTNITYGNCGSSPDGGSIAFSSSNGTSGQIDFSSECTVSGTWTSNTASGSF
jgi:hypothetical protein